MDNKNGVIYILTNPSFPDYVKIGYADDIDKRLKQLNRSECIPYAFRVYATYEVSSRLSDLKIHSIIDKLNPNLRAVESFNGKQRVREFYAMSPEDAYSILEAIAEIHGCVDKLNEWCPPRRSRLLNVRRRRSIPKAQNAPQTFLLAPVKSPWEQKLNSERIPTSPPLLLGIGAWNTTEKPCL